MRAAVRTLTLNLYGIEAPEVQAFLAGPQAAPYFTDLGVYMTERCQVGACSSVLQAVQRRSLQLAGIMGSPAEGTLDMLDSGSRHRCVGTAAAPCSASHVPVLFLQALDKALAVLQSGSPSAAREVEALLAEVETLLSYWNDILCTGETALARCVSTPHPASRVQHLGECSKGVPLRASLRG